MITSGVRWYIGFGKLIGAFQPMFKIQPLYKAFNQAGLTPAAYAQVAQQMKGFRAVGVRVVKTQDDAKEITFVVWSEDQVK